MLTGLVYQKVSACRAVKMFEFVCVCECLYVELSVSLCFSLSALTTDLHFMHVFFRLKSVVLAQLSSFLSPCLCGL